MLRIRWAGLDLTGDTGHRGTGLVVKPDGFQGWRGLPEGRRQTLARAVQHGEFDTPVFLPSRVVTVDAWIIADTARELDHLADRVAGAGAAGDLSRFQVDTGSGPRFADGRRVLGIVEDWPYGYLETSCQLQFVFTDPRKYGDIGMLPGDRLSPRDPSAVATSVPVSHYGNFPAYPVIEIPSAPAAYSITAAGRTFTVSDATAGGTHEVRLRSGRVYRNGVEMPRVGHGDLWTVPDGETVTHTLSVPGRVKIIDTFV